VISLCARLGTTTPSDAAAAITNFRAAITNFRLDFAVGYYATPVTLAVIGRAMDLTEKHGLCGCDAVQLATALQVQAQRQVKGLPSVVFMSADANLNAAATAEGLVADNPNAHP